MGVVVWCREWQNRSEWGRKWRKKNRVARRFRIREVVGPIVQAGEVVVGGVS